MSGTVEVKLKESARGAARQWMIPADAIVGDESGQPFVWRVNRDTMAVKQAFVKVGDMRDNRVAVLDGLKPGDTIVTAGGRLLRQGMKIRVMEAR